MLLIALLEGHNIVSVHYDNLESSQASVKLGFLNTV